MWGFARYSSEFSVYKTEACPRVAPQLIRHRPPNSGLRRASASCSVVYPEVRSSIYLLFKPDRYRRFMEGCITKRSVM